MSLSDKIKAAEDELVETKDQLTEATEELDADPDSAEAIAKVEELSERAENQTKSLTALKRAEQALAAKSLPIGNPQNAPAYVRNPGTNAKGGALNAIIKSAVCTLLSGMEHKSIGEVMEERYKDNDQVKAITGFMVSKGAQNPAMTNNATWASALVEEGMGELLDLLKPLAIIPRLPLRRFSFDGYGSLRIPVRNQSAYPTNLQASFRGEGQPIRIGSASIGSKVLTPKNMAVIATYTDEILNRANASLEQLLRDWIVQDTAEMLDAALLSNAAEVVGVSPAGILNGIAGADTAASAGTTLANIQADIKGRLVALANHNMGQSPVWIMHPSRQIALATLLTATGTLAYPSVQNGSLLGAPIVTSTMADQGTVILVDAAHVAFAYDGVRFSYSNVATLHEENLQADVKPIDTAAPVRSLFQTNSNAIKANYYLDFAVLRAGAVQSITGVAW